MAGGPQSAMTGDDGPDELRGGAYLHRSHNASTFESLGRGLPMWDVTEQLHLRRDLMLMAVDVDEIATDTQCSAPAEHRDSETKLSKEIEALWSAHQNGKATAKRTRAELKSLRRDLGERLHIMKTLLARTGRGGQWTSYLREHKISRTSADRWALEHEERLNPGSTNRTDVAISEPTEADVTKFFNRLLPQLRTVLTTQQAVLTLSVHWWWICPACTAT